MQQTAIVTGTSSGLGAALARLLIRTGYHVVGVSRSPSKTLAREGFTEILGDVADAETGRRALVAAREAGNFDLLINCAGAGMFGAPGSLTDAAIKSCISANLTGLILMSEACYGALIENGGTLVNIASTAGIRAKANEAIYCAAKWGVRGYTESLKAEAKSGNLRIIGVYPGGMKTAFWDAIEHTKGNRDGFMEVGDVAEAIMATLTPNGRCGVSDVVLEGD